MKYLALAALFLVVTAVGPLADTSVSDLYLYNSVAELIAGGRVPYLDFDFEYPPLAALPLWLANVPGGTAYMSDVGMTGPRGGVIGVRKEQAIKSLVDQLGVRFETSDDDPWLMGVLIRCGAPPRAEAIEPVRRAWAPAA